MRATCVAAGIAAVAAACAASAAARVARVAIPARHPTELERLIAAGLPVYCGGHERREIALTFDDGPGPYTPLAMRILRRVRARATFFLVGNEVVLRPALPRREAQLGALGDHTWTHAFLPRLPAADVWRELARTKALVERVAGVRVELFRPPYGAHTPLVDSAARRLGMLEVLWSIDSLDSEGAPWNRIAAKILEAARPGSIILMHENHGQTIRALKFVVLPALRRHHLLAVSLPELLETDPPTLAQLRAGVTGCSGSPPVRRAG